MREKKLQVFVSSTYTDMIEERQAAVEAILVAGHIPAGMELFAAGDQTQLEVIRRWIDESDVFLLLLGGRYGSVDPQSGKSYVHLEYEHAISSSKPLFAVVIDSGALEDKVKRLGKVAIETENAQGLRDFQAQVLTRIVRFWREPRDIKLAILEALSDYGRRDDLIGWTRPKEEVNVAALAEEIARLAKENAALRVQAASSSEASLIYEGLTFDEFYRLLATTPTVITDASILASVRQTAKAFGDSNVGLLHLLWVFEDAFRRGVDLGSNEEIFKDARRLEDYGVVQSAGSSLTSPDSFTKKFRLSHVGSQFLLRLRVKRDAATAEAFQAREKAR